MQMPRNDYYRQSRHGPSDLREQAHPIKRTRHANVGDYQVGAECFQDFLCLGGIARFDDLVTLVPKFFAKHPSDKEFVLDDKNAFTHWSKGWASRRIRARTR